jgi:hypothetical protein
MHGKKIQPTATVFERKARPNEGFALRNNHGIEVPIVPPTATRTMYLRDREKIVLHESVCAFGNRQARDAIMAAERHPVMISNQISAEESSRGWVSSGTGSLTQEKFSPLG